MQHEQYAHQCYVLCNCWQVAEQLVMRTQLLPWLLARVRKRAFDGNKQYASEVIAILVQVCCRFGTHICLRAHARMGNGAFVSMLRMLLHCQQHSSAPLLGCCLV